MIDNRTVYDIHLENQRRALVKEWSSDDCLHFERTIVHFKEFLASEDLRKQRLKEREDHELEKVRQLWGEELIITREEALRELTVKYQELERKCEELEAYIKGESK